MRAKYGSVKKPLYPSICARQARISALRGDDGAVVFRRKVAPAQGGDLLLRALDLQFEAVDVTEFEQRHHGAHPLVLVRALLFLVQKIK